MKKLLQLGLKGKINLLVIIVGIISTAITATVTTLQSKDAIEMQVVNQLSSSSKMMKSNLSDYFSRSIIFNGRLAADRLIEGLFIAFEGGYYGGAFKDNIDNNILNKTYLANDKLYGSRTRKMAKDFDIKNILLASINGQVIMSSTLDKDAIFLGRHLLTGSIKASTVASCFNNALKSKDNKVAFADFQYYTASKAVHSFMCKKMLAEFDHEDEGIYKGDTLGVVITEVDASKVNSIVSERAGMGETGQFYLVGNDHLLRSDMHLEKKKYNYLNSVKNKINIKAESITKALKGESGLIETVGPNGQNVIAYYDFIEIFGKKWAFISEKSTKEINAPVVRMVRNVLLLAVIVLAIIVAVSLFLSKALSQPISNAVVSLQGITQEVFDNSSNMKKYSADLSDLSTSMSSSIQETMSTMDELTQMVNKNIDNVTRSGETSEASKKAVGEGLTTVDDLISAFSEINESNEGVADTMKSTSHTMIEISDVIKSIAEKTTVINDIVFQTKLLSFNASVEAARAGEHGKGFAVVAEEVGNLALASGKAAIEISDLVSSSVEQVENIVKTTNERVKEVTEVGLEKVQKGNTIAKSCGDKLREILENVTNVDTAIEEVKYASSEQSVGIQEVAKAMEALNIVSNNSSSLSTDILSSSSTLDDKSKDLETVVLGLDQLLAGEEGSETEPDDTVFTDDDFDGDEAA